MTLPSGEIVHVPNPGGGAIASEFDSPWAIGETLKCTVKVERVNHMSDGDVIVVSRLKIS
jgi:hypothetical protein